MVLQTFNVVFRSIGCDILLLQELSAESLAKCLLFLESNSQNGAANLPALQDNVQIKRHV